MVNKKNIWIFNHYAQGPELPGGTRHYDIAKELVVNGYNVTIFAAGYHYTLLKDMVDYKDKDYLIEDKNGVLFVWVKTFPYKINNWRRIFNITSYSIKLNFLIEKLGLQNPDIIIGSTVHPFAPLIASKFAKRYKVPFIFEIRDLWPQTFIEMGIWRKNSFISRLFKYIEQISIKKSDKIIVLSPLTIDYLSEEYQYSKDRILLLPNGVNEIFLQNISQSEEERIKIIYLGGIDKVHGLDFLIYLANNMKDYNIIFHIYGDGKDRINLENMCKDFSLKNVIWHGSISKRDVPSTLNKAHLLFVSTSNVNYGSENKLYEYMAVGKPIISAVSSSHNDPISRINCGLSLDRENLIESSRRLIDFIKKEREKFEILGKNGQEYVIKNRLIPILTKKLKLFIKEENV